MYEGKRMAHGKSHAHSRSRAGSRVANGFALRGRLSAKRITLAFVVTLATASACGAGELAIGIVDRAGRPVGDVVVTLAPLAAQPTHRGTALPTAVMDQRNLAFVPRVLVVATGTSVSFPNSDSVSHQVYSFSAAKRFQLPLYKGEGHAPVIFDHDGLVVLGCNIHDEMAGYIYVTSAAWFGTTDAAGTLRVPDLPGGDYQLTLWSPLVADPPPTLTRPIAIAAQGVTPSRVQLARELRARPEPRPRRGDWEY